MHLLGKERNWAAMILPSIITLGIYGLFYCYNTLEEVKRFGLVKNPTVKVNSGGAAVGFLFIPFFDGVWAIMLVFKYPGLLTNLNQISNRSGPSYEWLGFVNIIPILGGLIVMIVVQTKLNDFWRELRTLLSAISTQTTVGYAPTA